MADEFVPQDQKRYQYERRERKDYLTRRLNDFFRPYDLRDVERRTHISRSHIRTYLNGTALPSLAILAVLHNILGLDLNELVKEPESGEAEHEISHSSLTTLSEAGIL